MLLDVSTRLCVIVGGGEVAARKARGLLDAGATRVRVIAPELRAAFPPGVEIVSERFNPVHLENAELVFAATDDPAVNDSIAAVAKQRGALLNRADQDEDAATDFLTPARLQRGEVMMTITAISPALAVHIRNHLEKQWRPGWSQMAAVMRDIRPQLVSSQIAIERRREIFRNLATEEAIDLLEIRGIDALKQWLYDRHPDVKHA